jgi:hypothetical protein
MNKHDIKERRADIDEKLRLLDNALKKKKKIGLRKELQ